MMDYEAPRDFRSRDPYAPREPREFKVPIVASEMVKRSAKVVFPVEEYPRYNFIRRILGPKGNTIKELQAATKCKMQILGRGSTRDRKSEEELSKSGEEKHEHLKEPLHILIEAKATQIEAHRRLAAALREVYKFMVPSDDTMVPDQMDARPLYHNESGGGRPGGSRDAARLPIIKYGTPPPGALILSEKPPRSAGRPQRGGRRGPPADGYETPVKGYSENRDGGYNDFF